MTSDAPSLPGGSWAGLRVLVLSPVPTWPVTLGNRNRIVQVNRALQREGAHIALLHYPSDEEWRTSLPRTALAEMASQWDEVFHAPVTRPLHTRPAEGEDHGADDWWDPAIGQMLDWLLKVGRYDALLVNYTWLSKALEHAPAGVLRILDTHDRFSNRRELLADNGLRPEYFHTTPEQERLALDRADIVWAIKRQEEAFFRTLTNRPVRTLLHAEPAGGVPATAARDGVLRLGIVGGRNNINATNIRNFLKVADAYLRRTLLPVEILVAGSVCTLLEGLRLPYLRLLGAVESMDELYAEADVVLAPLAFSTGLKIKVGEALSRGKPLVSHAHAFEGYVPTHPFHECTDFEAMMRAIHRLVREPEEVAVLAEASRRSVVAAEAEILATIREAGARARELPPSAVLSLRFEQARLGTLAFDHVLDAARYLGLRVPVVFHLAGDPATAEPAALKLLVTRGRIVMDPASAPGAAASALFDDTEPRLASLGALLAAPHLLAWFAGLPAAPPAGEVRMQLGICHMGALALQGEARDQARLSTLAAAFPRFLLIEDAPTREAAAATRAAGAERAAMPLLWRGEDCRLLATLRGAPEGAVALLTEDPDARELAPVLACLTTMLGRQVRIFAPEGVPPVQPWPTSGPLAVRAEAISFRPIEAFFEPSTWAQSRPAFVVEHGRPARTIPAREVALRAGIPHLRIADPAAPPVVSTAPAMSYRTSGFLQAALVLSALHHRAGGSASGPGAAEEYGRDAGWARLWRELGRLLAAA
ncbi:glycosyltransferase [Neoroseomonas soli]|uniref:Glycosyltransferase n=1 Tax=Neoroseomonas soli TaxID=1081025 RepID=A0A9X9X290_9PROT|nr:glycosyltransferase [Neoroseomonas soli]MBR0673519.1 glycosyltransferase [Neoroseomonas soli]